MSVLLTNSEAPPTVSVVIPLYNKGKNVKGALSSILAQTYQPLEIIVVDDGSTDDGPEAVRKFKDPRIILIRQENKGPGAARNIGLAKATCKYIAFLDADDEWLPSFLENGLSLLEDKVANISVVWTGFFIHPSMKKNNEGMDDLSGVYEVSTSTDVNLIKKIITFSWTSTTIVRTDVARKFGGFFDCYKCRCGEDTHFFIKLIFNERAGIIPEPLAIYHTEASNLWGCEHKALPPLEPFMEDPREIIDACPLEKRDILRRLLALRALEVARAHALWGKRREAKTLLKRFWDNQYFSNGNLSTTRLMAEIAPILPPLREFRRLSRSIMGMKRVQI